MKFSYVYILTNKPFGTLYIRVTSNLERRIQEHKCKLVPGFTKEYDLNMLVYFETHEDINNAIQREKNMKRWYRDWKIDLINKHNPEWKDLALEWMDHRIKSDDDEVMT